MSIDGIRGPYRNPALPPGLRDRPSIDESGERSIRARKPSTGDVIAAQRSTDLVPAEAPPGTDPTLWSVLTTEERMFFATAQPAGPLTYGPNREGRVSSGPLLGGRIDLKA